MASMPMRQTPCNSAAELILTLDTVEGLSGIRDVLRILVARLNAFGVILWEVAQGTEDLAARRLFVQSDYFQHDLPPPFFELPMDSISGRAILSNTPANHARENGVWKVDVNYPQELERLGITAFVTVPIHLRGSGIYSDAALTFYRTSGHFSEAEFQCIQESATLFPSIYKAVLGKVSLKLVNLVQELFRHAHYPSNSGKIDALELARKAIGQVTGVIKQQFQSMEVAIYLREPTAERETFQLLGVEWPWSTPPIKDQKSGHGGTGWVLRHGKPLQILDMRCYESDLQYYGRQYPGMAWKDRIGIAEQVRRVLRLKPGQDLPPLSYVCVPILHEDRVLGALRCCVQKKGPYYFDDDLTQALCSIADLIGDWWVHWQDERRQDVDQTRLLQLLDALSNTNREALAQLAEPSEDPSKIMDLALEACQKLAPEFEILQVWTKHLQKNELYLARQLIVSDPAAPRGRYAIAPLTQGLIGDRKNAFVEVWNTREPKLVGHATDSEYALPNCSRCKSFVVAPILVDAAPHGVLVLLSHQTAEIMTSVERVAKFIARQLALYEALRSQLHKIQQAYREQGALLLDFQHQVRSPVNMAYSYAEGHLQKSDDGNVEETLKIIMEATRRASSVASNLSLFVQLAQEHPPLAKLQEIKPSELFARLRHTLRYLYSHRALGKHLNFEIDESWRTGMRTFFADADRLDLVLDNVIENAVKYSFKETTIRIAGGLARDGNEVYISFQNKGLPIGREEVERIKNRGYRGNAAKLAHPEGNGIGLWMGAQVLKSMHGRLDVAPTNAVSGVNEIRIYLRRQHP